MILHIFNGNHVNELLVTPTSELVDNSLENRLHREEIADENAWMADLQAAVNSGLYDLEVDEHGELYASRLHPEDEDWKVWKAVACAH